MSNKRAWRWAWSVWAIVSGGSFAVLEAMALRRSCHPTLSTTLRRTLGTHPHHRWAPVSLLALTAFWVWLTVHLAYPPEDIHFGTRPLTPGPWIEVTPGIWYRATRRKKLI